MNVGLVQITIVLALHLKLTVSLVHADFRAFVRYYITNHSHNHNTRSHTLKFGLLPK